MVEVKFVKGAPRVANSLPAAARQGTVRPPPARERPKKPPKPVPAVIQPRVVAAEIEPPSPAEPSEPEPDPQEEGVVGGTVGEVASAGAAPVQKPVRPEFNAATMTRPVFVSGPEPTYTRRAMEQEVAGLMVVRCILTVEGAVRDCRVLKGLPHMDSAVVDALEHRRYKPATQNGKPVEIEYVFKLNLKVPR